MIFQHKPSASIELPWYQDALFLSTTTPPPALVGTNSFVTCSNTAQPMLISMSAGDDFSMHFLRPPPAGALATSLSTTGYALANTFFSSP